MFFTVIASLLCLLIATMPTSLHAKSMVFSSEQAVASVPPQSSAPPIIKRPDTLSPLNGEKERKLEESKNWYALAQLYIQAGLMQKAETALDKALQKHPEYLQAELQLGFVLLWEQKLDNAYSTFSKVLRANPCERTALTGLYDIASTWSATKSQEAVSIYESLLSCEPGNADYLFYYGRVLSWMDKTKEAKAALQHCLQLAPQYTDAALMLADLYMREDEIDEAETIYKRYPDNVIAREGLAKIAVRRENPSSPPIIEPPKNKTALDEKQIKHLEQDGDWYTLAQIYIQRGHLEKAQEALAKVLPGSLDYEHAQVQQGFIFLWQKQFDRAFPIFSALLHSKSCNKTALLGLYTIANTWSLDAKKRSQALLLYETLLHCDPNNPDYLFYYGKALSWTKDTKKAKTTLLHCLQLAPEYTDAALILAALYRREGELTQAQEIYERYPDNATARAGLAQIAASQGHSAKAHEHFTAAMHQNPNHDTRLAYARFLMSENLFSDAQTPYEYLLNDDPYNDILWRDMYEAKTHTDVSLLLETDYVEGQEHDPDIQQPVVKEYYFNQKVHLMLPLRDSWLLDVRGIFSHQKENDIYIPIGTNFNVLLAGGQVTSSLLFAKYWRWDVILREFGAWGSGTMFYPFQNTHRFEPGTTLRYTSNAHSLLLDAHIESFVIKNYDLFVSQLLKLSYIDAGYTYHPEHYLHPSINAWVARVFYNDNLHNIRNTQDLSVESGLPKFEKFLSLGYFFEHSTFKQLNINYYSFKRQTRNTLRVKLHTNPNSHAYFEIFYDRTWQKTHDLFQPIGDFVFIAPYQLIIENKLWANYSYRLKDKARIEFGGYYYRDTLPSWYYNLKGAISWRF